MVTGAGYELSKVVGYDVPPHHCESYPKKIQNRIDISM